jgi:hypothetical protein
LDHRPLAYGNGCLVLLSFPSLSPWHSCSTTKTRGERVYYCRSNAHNEMSRCSRPTLNRRSVHAHRR